MYKWNNEQLKKIWTAIDKELRLCKESFEESKTEEFRL